MNKKLLAAAIGVALAGSMAGAVADVTLYGNVNVSIDSIDIDGGSVSTTSNGVDTNGDDVNMHSNTSAIGVKGSEDLGNGYQAIFQAEFEFDATEATGLSGRDQYVGVQAGFGKIRFGALSTSYKSHGAMIDPIYRTSLQGRQHGLQSVLHSDTSGSSGRDGRMTNHVRYDSPSFHGFSGTVDYSFDESEIGDDDAYGVGLQYMNGPALVFADYITSDRGGNDEAWKVGGSWDFGDIDIYGQYEVDDGLISSNVAGNPIDGNDVWHVGSSLALGNSLIYLAFGQGDGLDTPGGTLGGYTVWTIAVDHHLSNRTDAYAGFNQIDCDDGGGQLSTGTTGPEHPCLVTGFPDGGEIDFFSVGLRHKF